MIDEFMRAAIDEAEQGLQEGGIPIGSVLVHGRRIRRPWRGVGARVRATSGANGAINSMTTASASSTTSGSGDHSTSKRRSRSAGSLGAGISQAARHAEAPGACITIAHSRASG